MCRDVGTKKYVLRYVVGGSGMRLRVEEETIGFSKSRAWPC